MRIFNISIGLKGIWTTVNNMLNLKTAELYYMTILHSRPSKFYNTKNNAISRGDSLCFGIVQWYKSDNLYAKIQFY